MTLRNLILALKHQLPLKRAFHNFVITRNAWGMFHKNSHVVARTGLPKIMYSNIKSATKAGEAMEKKHGGKFRPYKCVFCDGFHIGKNRV